MGVSEQLKCSTKLFDEKYKRIHRMFSAENRCRSYLWQERREAARLQAGDLELPVQLPDVHLRRDSCFPPGP